MIHLFIDTNIYLSFYHFSKEDLESLENLSKLINLGKIKLYIPEQVRYEFFRNRENKIKDALNRLEGGDNSVQIPLFCEGYTEAKELQEVAKKFKIKKEVLIAKVKSEISKNSLKADNIIKELFELVPCGDFDSEILQRAHNRADLGNPPGKKNSLGDAINWEYLLLTVDDCKDLYFISEDSDYKSVLKDDQFSPFLLSEWKNKKNTSLIYFNALYKFFKSHFPDIKFIEEEIKDAKILAFEESPNFDAARARLEVLYKINDFSLEQINRIVNASINNGQIYRAHYYSPELIGLKLESIISGYEGKIDFDNYRLFCNLFGISRRPRIEDLLDDTLN